MRRITDPAELSAYRRSIVQFHAPHAQRMLCKTGDAEAFVWSDSESRPRAIAWLGRSMHPYSGNGGHGAAYRFKTPEARAQWVTECFRRATAHAERIAKDRAEKAAKRAQPHSLQVGDVLRSCWGYEQTNTDYYQVTALIGSTMVEYRKIGEQSMETGFMSGDSVPAPGSFIGPAKRARVSDYGQRDSFKVCSFASAHKMQPTIVGGVACYKPSYWSSYA